MKLIQCFVISVASAMLALSASAAPVTWTLTDTTFDDGGTATGSFVYDADTNLYSHVNITTTTGSIRVGETYTHVCSGPCAPQADIGADFVLFLNEESSDDMLDKPAVSLVFEEALSDTGTEVNIIFSFESLCDVSDCSAVNTSVSRMLATGRVTSQPFVPPVAVATPVPTLGQWSLMLLTPLLAGITALRTRRHS